jgi:hypothetical protein
MTETRKSNPAPARIPKTNFLANDTSGGSPTKVSVFYILSIEAAYKFRREQQSKTNPQEF